MIFSVRLMPRWFTGLLLLLPFATMAQHTLADHYKDTLNALAHNMQRGENDTIRFTAGNTFQYIIEQILQDSTSFHTSFDAVKNISVKTTPDQLLRIYTWTFPDDKGVYSYHGYVQTINKKTQKTTLFTLQDSSSTIQKPTAKKLKPGQWYGAAYYDIVQSTKSGKNYYILLGWHGKDKHITQKIIDVVSVQNGIPVFGLPVFKQNNIYTYRVIFEYTSLATLSLRYVSANKMIVFDHLATNKKNEPNLPGMTGPDGTYDAYKFKKGRWQLTENIDINNNFVPHKPDKKIFKDNELQEMNPKNKNGE